MELPIDVIQKYKIRVSTLKNGATLFSLDYNDHNIGILVEKIQEGENAWNIYTPGGTVVSFYKEIQFIHISCL